MLNEMINKAKATATARYEYVKLSECCGKAHLLIHTDEVKGYFFCGKFTTLEDVYNTSFPF